MTDQERTIGRLEARVEDLRHDVQQLTSEVRQLTDLVAQVRGARWAVGLTAGFLSFLSTMAATAAGIMGRH